MIEITYSDYDGLDEVFQNIRTEVGGNVPSVEELQTAFFPNVLSDPFVLPYLIYLDQYAERVPETQESRKAINAFIRRNVTLVDDLPADGQPQDADGMVKAGDLA